MSNKLFGVFIALMAVFIAGAMNVVPDLLLEMEESFLSLIMYLLVVGYFLITFGSISAAHVRYKGWSRWWTLFLVVAVGVYAWLVVGMPAFSDSTRIIFALLALLLFWIGAAPLRSTPRPSFLVGDPEGH